MIEKINDDEEISEKKETKPEGGIFGIQLTNNQVLVMTTVLFTVFVTAEIVGALASNSLSLLGDACAIMVDVFTYFCNIYAEWVRSKYGKVSHSTRRVLEVHIPAFSVIALLVITGYITSEAICIIRGGQEEEDVNVCFLWAFSVSNFIVDALSSFLFYLRGKDGLLPGHEMNTPALDREAVDMAKRHPLASLPIPNLNMLSALTHVGGDTLRTISVFVAAAVSTATGISGAMCDAWAMVVVSFTILLCVIPLCREIYKAYKAPIPPDEDDDEGNEFVSIERSGLGNDTSFSEVRLEDDDHDDGEIPNL